MDRNTGGLLVCLKPEGPSSHSAVERVKRALGARRAGHAGTLDPAASGVLLVGLNRATRLLEYLAGHDKTYRAVLQLGEVRDTLDRTGALLEQRPVPDLDVSRVRSVLGRFSGRIRQVPPAYSAIKVGGERLYRRARRGERVDPPARWVTIHALELLRLDPPELEIRVVCSAGTYVRALARDVGEALGCGAVLWRLERLRSGPFGLADAVPLEIVEAEGPDAWKRVLPPERMLQGMPLAHVDAPAAADLAHGRPVPWRGEPFTGPVAVCGPGGELVAVGRVEAGRLRPAKVLRPAR